MPFQVLEIAEGLQQLDPIRSYPERGAALVQKLAGAVAFRLDLDGEDEPILSDPPPEARAELQAFALRSGRQVLGTLHLAAGLDGAKLGSHEARLARWGARMLARGMSYARRLAVEGGRRMGGLDETLDRSPLTPREKDVVALLVAGSSTRDIAKKTRLTVATVNTYMKRIFSKLGVHSRVELVARVAGTGERPRSDPAPLPEADAAS